MSNEIEVKKRCICLRNGNEIWVTEETYQKFRKAKEEAGGNILIYISELDRELNTADVVEICTPSQMDEKRRIERGERKCVYGMWHKKREVCDCFKRIRERKKEHDKRVQEREENKPLTDEQRAKNKEIRKSISQDLKRRGII